ncbi:MAG: hypothetical protein GXY77_11225 [Fibrobacter sp.]|nr:hypothetical protein [Fibrobacter sp.]
MTRENQSHDTCSAAVLLPEASTKIYRLRTGTINVHKKGCCKEILIY